LSFENETKKESIIQNPAPNSAINPQPSEKLVVFVRRNRAKRRRVEIQRTETADEFYKRTGRTREIVPASNNNNQKQIKKRTLEEYSKAELLEKVYNQEAVIKDLTKKLTQARRQKKGRLTGDFYDTRAWQNLRYKALKHYGRTCAFCKETNGRMHVDHIKPRSRFPHLQFQFSNLQVLCEACNLGKGNSDRIDWRSHD
jgi:5-methylcytosine-specific restriction endonuclease McrA